MPETGLACRLIEIVGERYSQSAFWGEHGSCDPARTGIGHFSTVDWPTYGIDYSWTPTPCAYCSKEYDGSEIKRAAGTHHVYSTDSGRPEPGDCFFVPDYDGRCFFWDNCDGRHLHVILPNGSEWDVDGRASNCTRPNDRKHRCWIRTGTPPKVTAGKAPGDTCTAGAGSIQSGDYHGFLLAGVLT